MIHTSKIPTPNQTKTPDNQPRDPKGVWKPPSTNRVKTPEFDFSKMPQAHPAAEKRIRIQAAQAIDLQAGAALKAQTAKILEQRPEKKVRGK